MDYSTLTSLLFYGMGISVMMSLLHVLSTKRFKASFLAANGMGGGGAKGGGEAPAAPAPPPPPPAPTEDAEVVRQRAESERRRVAAAKGYSATDLTNGVFAGGNSEDVKKPTLLGG